MARNSHGVWSRLHHDDKDDVPSRVVADDPLACSVVAAAGTHGGGAIGGDVEMMARRRSVQPPQHDTEHDDNDLTATCDMATADVGSTSDCDIHYHNDRSRPRSLQYHACRPDEELDGFDLQNEQKQQLHSSWKMSRMWRYCWACCYPDGHAGSSSSSSTASKTSSRRRPGDDYHEYWNQNFVVYSILFSANHSAGLACLALATTRLGSIVGAWQTAILYSTYTGSALLGITVVVVQQLGAKRATVLGMALFSLYVLTSCLATIDGDAANDHDGNKDKSTLLLYAKFTVYVGAALGGMGAGIAWTAQGVYMNQAVAAAAASAGVAAVAMTTTSTVAATRAGYSHGVDHHAQQSLVTESPEAATASVTATASKMSDDTDDDSIDDPSLSTTTGHSSTTSSLSAVFAVAILVGETLLDALATLLVRAIGVHWAVVFAIYLAIAVAATVGLQLGADAYPDSQSCCTHVSLSTSHGSRSDCRTNTLLDPLMATIRLLITDAKMKYMLGFTAAFGLTGAFLNAFVSGQVVPRALHDPHGAYVGILVAWHGIVAALAAVILGNAPHLWFWYCRYRRSFHGQHDTTVPTLGAAAPTMVGMNECILIAGSIAFGMVALPFLFRPNLDEWTWGLLILVYALQGFGRATFEGTLKVLFAEYFTNHLEAAYSNIILQYGLSSAAAYIWSTRFRCELHDVDDAAVRRNPYCVEYRDGSGHNLFTFAAIVVGTSLVAALGFLRASQISTTAAHRPLTNHHESIS